MLGKAYAHTAHVYGFIAEGDPTTDRVPIVPAASIKADKTLVTNSIKVTLDAFRIQEYPGLGLHTVLFDFIGRDQAGDESQDLRFASVFKANDKDNAALNGAPVFTGLTVPPDGLSFQARTITIRSAGDETILNVLQSAAFKDGLKLLGHVQPALPQLVGLAGGITENLLKRRWNRQVQCFDLGLDFSRSLTSARLRRGSYVVVQVPDVRPLEVDKLVIRPGNSEHRGREWRGSTVQHYYIRRDQQRCVERSVSDPRRGSKHAGSVSILLSLTRR